MVTVNILKKMDKKIIDEVVNIHMSTFEGFFLTFLGKGFLKEMYKAYCEYDESGLILAYENNRIVGFLSFSGDMSGLYKYMIRKKVFVFAWYSIGAFFRKPLIFIRLIRAFLKPSESKRKEKYIELSSIGVSPESKSKGIGTMLIDELKKKIDFSVYKYISLETDAVDNTPTNKFYLKNGFSLVRTYETREGRKMNEYHWSKE